MEEEIKEIKEILLKINNLNNEISYLDTLIIKYEKEIDSLEEKINSYTINIRDRIDFLYKERAKLKNRINDIKASKKKLKLKVIITLISAICLSTSLVFNNISSIIFLLATIVGTSSIILNVLSNKKKEKEISNLILKEIISRLEFLNNVGLSYLTLTRSAGTLSGGEAQRIRLATQIGSKLSGVLYVLDEPSIGLHQKDNERLINSLKEIY